MLATSFQSSSSGYMPESSEENERTGATFDENAENQDPAVNQSTLDVPSKKLVLQSDVPPGFKNGANGRQRENINHLQIRRQRPKHYRDPHRVALARAVFSHPKYLAYLNRSRRDIGRDGKQVWSDEAEVAFQNALICIEPMGKGKTVQNGKTCGRNELVAEWIFEETNERRDRKQISSHIQQLGIVLQGVPEWKALTRLPPGMNNAGRHRLQYYNDSIRQQVSAQRSAKHEDLDIYDDFDAEYELDPEVNPTKLEVQRLLFDMFLGLPNKMDMALHRYTHLQESKLVCRPLEDIEDWRTKFPQLEAIITQPSSRAECSLVLIDASLCLMKEFPKKPSKLGLIFELDFTNQHRPRLDLFRQTKQWLCATSIYQNGVLTKDAIREVCIADEHHVGVIRPTFESKWWASTFSKLVEQRITAEQTGNDLALFQADEYSQDLLQHLTFMQEIFADTQPQETTSQIWYDTASTQTRMTILLWRFSQAPEGVAGCTTWCRLSFPPERSTINSPPPPESEMALPPLDMETVLEQVPTFVHHGLPDSEVVAGHGPVNADDIRPAKRNTSSRNPDGHPRFDSRFGLNSTMTSMHYNPLAIGAVGSGMETSQTGSNAYYMTHAETYGDLSGLAMSGLPDIDDHSVLAYKRGMSSSPLRPPMSSFDMSTHTALQEQLRPRPTAVNHNDLRVLTVVDPRNVSFSGPDPTPTPSSKICYSVNDHAIQQASPLVYPYFMANRLQRPMLQHHHSFAAFDTAPQYDLGLVTHPFNHTIKPPVLQSNAPPLHQYPLSAREAERPVMHDELLVRPHSQPAFLTHEDPEPNFESLLQQEAQMTEATEDLMLSVEQDGCQELGDDQKPSI